jgi:hypothetical protein
MCARRGGWTVWAVAFAVLCAGSPAFGADVTLARPGLITAIGQSADVNVVKILLNTQLKLGLEFKPLAQVGDLAGIKTIVMVVGASAKGLGAAGLDMDKELTRTRALLQAARAQGAQVLVMHTGGETRRGKTSNDLIEAVMPEAAYVVVVASGNKDKLFQTLAAKRNTPVSEVEKLSGAGDVVKGLFK